MTISDSIFTTTASSQRLEPGSFNIQAEPWPKGTTDESIDAAGTANKIIDSFNQALDSKELKALSSLFLQTGYWRDHLALSWTLRTLKGRDKILAFLNQNQDFPVKKVEIDSSSDFRKPQLTPFAPSGGSKGIGFFITFTTQHGSGRGMVRLVEDADGEWKIWTFYTALDELNGHKEPLGANRPGGVKHGATPGRRNWADRRRDEENFVDTEPDVLIIGAGQGGLTAAARLKMLNVPSLIIDKNDQIGDNWRKRYHQLVLHDPVWYDHMPYQEFPKFWPIYTPKDKLADWFESYAKLLELNAWMKSEIVSSSWDDETKQWTVVVRRVHVDGREETRTLKPKHVVLATGHSGKKYLPSIPGMGEFKGSLLCHSSEFPGAKETDGNSKKRAIVVGACNSSHDICQDYYEKGYQVTMVQRSSTCVVSADASIKVNVGVLYSEFGPSVKDADVWLWGWPSEVFKAIHTDLCKVQIEHDAELLAGLSKAGFKVDKGVNDAGLFSKYIQRGGGYYIDVGTSKLIIDGKVGIKSGVEITEVTAHGVRFSDGTELEADEIVFATGYENMRTQAGGILGEDVQRRVGDIWGWDEEGEIRTIWRESGHPGVWFHGGNLALSRYYSRVLALQIKARLEGLV
ncbi:hypothetical protein V8F06_005040 [Rhypophila decipiens]